MVPPPTLPDQADRVDIFTNLTAAAGATAPRPTLDMDSDGIPDASPLQPGRDAYITVMEQPVSQSVEVFQNTHTQSTHTQSSQKAHTKHTNTYTQK